MNELWISVKDQLPSMWEKSNYRSEDVWVTDGKEIWQTCYHVTGKRWMDPGQSWTGDITHWLLIRLPGEGL